MTGGRAVEWTVDIGGQHFEWGSRTFVMGIVNVTPDSFSGDGLAGDVDAAVRQALAFEAQGADIVDVGGESSRPPGSVYGEGAASVSVDEELARVMPVLERLRGSLGISPSASTRRRRRWRDERLPQGRRSSTTSGRCNVTRSWLTSPLRPGRLSSSCTTNWA